MNLVKISPIIIFNFFTMNEIMKFLQKRPTDTTIRVWRVLFWLIYVSVLYYNFFLQAEPNIIQNSLFWVSISDSTRAIIPWVIVAFWIPPIITWLFDISIMKSGKTRILQIIYAIILFYFSHIIVEWAGLDVDVLMFFLAFLPLIWWITWKIITKKWMNFWYKVTKVRV
jgi:hypothetical protein